tara:strand:- start:41575 stop:42672 length:1098 start_codon:yes stop_codon:yes gene_type:complete
MSKLPNVLHISTPKSWRGGEQQVAYLYEELEQKGITQYILCRKNSAMAKRGKSKGWNIIECRKTIAVDPFFARKVKSVCKQKQIDIVHAHDSHAHSSAVISASLFANTTPIVVSRRVDFAISRTSIKKYNHKNIKRIICVSEAVKKLTEPDIKNKSVLKTIHSGIDLSKFSLTEKKTEKLRKEYNIPDDIPLIGNVAAIAPHKDYFTFINTAEELIKRNLEAKFFIIGTGPLEEEIKKYCAQKQLDKHIIFTGFRTDIKEILPELTVFLITSETEGLGTSIIDAFACKVPVVATRAGGIPEIVKHEKSGLLADVKDAGELANQIERILSGNLDKKKIIEGQQRILQNFSKSVTAEKTLLEYLSIQ